LRPVEITSAWTAVVEVAVGLGVFTSSGCSVAVTGMVAAGDAGVDVVLAGRVEVAGGKISATSVETAGVKVERSSWTIVGVGLLALLGAAQAVRTNRVSHIKVVQIFIFILSLIIHTATLQSAGAGPLAWPDRPQRKDR
jgi:hypothetical protein